MEYGNSSNSRELGTSLWYFLLVYYECIHIESYLLLVVVTNLEFIIWLMITYAWLQTTQPTLGVTVTVVWQTLCKLCRLFPSPAIGHLWASQSCGPAEWLVLHLIKVGDFETNPGPTNTCKQVRICDIYHRQIQVRKHLSMRCIRIEHWVHLRCANIRLTQYTDTWTCHQHK